MNKLRALKWEQAPLLLILVGVLCAFWQVGTMSYVLWDDDLLITDNVILRMPLGEALKAAFFGYYNGDYMPLTLMSYWAEITLGGYQAHIHHLFNLALHCMNVVLCWFLLKRLVKDPWTIWIAVGLFALHPLQVETVAWISERKGLLATTFYLASLLAYDESTRDRGYRVVWSGLYLALYVLAVMSKANGVFLPLWVAFAECVRERKIVSKYWPLHLTSFLLVLAAVILRVSAYASAVPQLSAVMLTPERIWGWPLMILTVIGFYVRAFFAPANLSIIYPSYLVSGGWDVELLLGGIFVALILVAIVFLRSRQILIWSAFFLLSLAPVMNLVPRINFVNDRYVYMPMIAMSIILVQMVRALIDVVQRHSKVNIATARAMLLAMIVGGSFVLTYASYSRAQVWHDNLSLWGDTVQKVPGSSLAFNNLGQAYQERGDIPRAVEQFQRSLVLADNYVANLAINNLATIYSSKQYPDYFNLPLAKSLLEDGIAKVARQDDSLVLRYNLALVYLQMGDVMNGRRALEDLRLRIEQSSNQRFRFLLARVLDLQTKLKELP
jgi:hypothetical protein